MVIWILWALQMNWEFETSLRFETSIFWKFREGAQALKQEKNIVLVEYG